MAWNSKSRVIDYKVTIGVTPYGKDKIVKVSLVEGFSGSRSIGSVSSAQLDIELYLDSSNISKGDKLSLSVKESDSLYIDVGEFTVESIKGRGKVVNLTCYDNLFNADKQIGKMPSSGMTVVINGKEVIRGHLLSEYQSAIASKLGITGYSATYPVKVINPYPNNLAMRNILQDIAAVDMCSYVVDRSNNLKEIPAFVDHKGTSQHSIGPEDYVTCEVLEDTPKCDNVILNINDEDMEFSSYKRDPKTAFAYNLEYATQHVQGLMELQLSGTLPDTNFNMVCRGSFEYDIGDTVSVTMKDGTSFYSRIMCISTSLAGGMMQTISCSPLQGIGSVESERDSPQGRFVAVINNTAVVKDVKQVLDVNKGSTVIKHNTEPYYQYGKLKDSGKPISETSQSFESNKLQTYVRTGGTMTSSGGGMSTFSGTGGDTGFQVDYTKASGMEINEDGLYHLNDDIETGEVEMVRIPKTYIKDTEPDNTVGTIGDLWVSFSPESVEPTEPTVPPQEESPSGV